MLAGVGDAPPLAGVLAVAVVDVLDAAGEALVLVVEVVVELAVNLAGRVARAVVVDDV